MSNVSASLTQSSCVLRALSHAGTTSAGQTLLSALEQHLYFMHRVALSFDSSASLTNSLQDAHFTKLQSHF